MKRRDVTPSIRLRGVRHNNLKNFDLDLPIGRLIVVTGLSGSGKSSLAFDTLFAEGQRRYIETFSPYARQFLDRMDKPRVDRIDGIPPAIAIEQRNSVKTTRSTVGTMTELCDYMKLLWPHLAKLYCRQCGQIVRKDSPQLVWESITGDAERDPGNAPEVLITFHVPLSEKLSLGESLLLISKQGYQRLLLNNEIVRIEEALAHLQNQSSSSLTVIQDHLKLRSTNRARAVEACEQAYHFGKGKLTIFWIRHAPFAILRSQNFSCLYHCALCDLEYREPTPALFSFNHPIGACPSCRGFGRIITIDYHRAIPDRSRSLADGAVKPWQTGQGADCQRDLMRMCRHYGIPTNVPFARLSAKWQEWVINGDPNYGKDEEHEWPRAWYGVKGYFRWLESKAYKMHVRVLLSRYRAYSTCPECHGQRFQPESSLFKVEQPSGFARRFIEDENPTTAASLKDHSIPFGTSLKSRLLSLADFYQLTIQEALKFIEEVAAHRSLSRSDPIGLALNEVRSRLGYLVSVGLGYLTLDRPTRSLSGGETERVNLTTCLGTRLVNTLYVLDEPSVGLHPRDITRLVRILENLRDIGNTVVVVEHEASVMRSADQIVDLGPQQGEAGGHVVFQGPFKQLLESSESLTGQYLSGARRIDLPARRPVAPSSPRLSIAGATRHNLKNLTVEIPLQRFVCLTGVSGSGKTTLAREILLPLLEARLNSKDSVAQPEGDDSDSADEAIRQSRFNNDTPALTGHEHLGRVVLLDQSPLGKTPRSNPVVYIGTFDDIRELFAQTDLARQRGLNASAFSFNSSQGQCERCRGAGFEKIEMQFLSDVYIRCPDCNGRRYRAHILEVKLMASISHSEVETMPLKAEMRNPRSTLREWSIADLLETTVDDAIQVLFSFFHTSAGRRTLQSLKLLQEVGLGYLRLGQPINTLSGGESQRLKLVSHLVEFSRAQAVEAKPTLFVFDEPTTGLHFDDVRVLLKVFQRLVDGGHSLLVIEHNLDVIKCADWLIDLGPEAGEDGGRIVIQGTPEHVAAWPGSYTGQALLGVLGSS